MIFQKFYKKAEMIDTINVIEIVPTNIYLFNIINRNTRKRREIWSRLTKKIVNFDDISHFFLVFLLLNLNKYMLAEMTSLNMRQWKYPKIDHSYIVTIFSCCF